MLMEDGGGDIKHAHTLSLYLSLTHTEKMIKRRRRTGTKWLSLMLISLQLLCLIFVLVQPASGGRSSSSPSSYYEILGISKTANEKEIKKAYRSLALKHHPDKGGKEETFKEISKAYEVLSDPQQKQVYDAYGEAGIDNYGAAGAAGPGSYNPFTNAGGGGGGGGGPNPFGAFFSSSSSSSNNQQGFSFQSFGNGGGGSGTYNIDLSEILNKMMGAESSSSFQQQQRAGGSSSSFFQQTPSAAMPKSSYTRKVPCSLEELATGTTKKLKLKFKNGLEKVYKIDIKKGWKRGTKITFPGNQRNGLPTIVFIIQEVPHKFLRRDGNNLHYTCWISESQTKGGIVVKVPLPSKFKKRLVFFLF